MTDAERQLEAQRALAKSFASTGLALSSSLKPIMDSFAVTIAESGKLMEDMTEQIDLSGKSLLEAFRALGISKEDMDTMGADELFDKVNGAIHEDIVVDRTTLDELRARYQATSQLVDVVNTAQTG